MLIKWWYLMCGSSDCVWNIVDQAMMLDMLIKWWCLTCWSSDDAWHDIDQVVMLNILTKWWCLTCCWSSDGVLYVDQVMVLDMFTKWWCLKTRCVDQDMLIKEKSKDHLIQWSIGCDWISSCGDQDYYACRSNYLCLSVKTTTYVKRRSVKSAKIWSSNLSDDGDYYENLYQPSLEDDSRFQIYSKFKDNMAKNQKL